MGGKQSRTTDKQHGKPDESSRRLADKRSGMIGEQGGTTDERDGMTDTLGTMPDIQSGINADQNGLTDEQDEMMNKQDGITNTQLMDSGGVKGTRGIIDTGNTKVTVDNGDTRDTIDNGDTRDTIDTGDTRDTIDTGDTRDTIDTAESRDNADTSTLETLELVDTGDARAASDTTDIEDTINVAETRYTGDTNTLEILKTPMGMEVQFEEYVNTQDDGHLPTIHINLQKVTILDSSQKNVLAVSNGSCDEYPIIYKPKPTEADPSSEFFRLWFRPDRDAPTATVFINLHSGLPVGIVEVSERVDCNTNEEEKKVKVLYSHKPSSWNINLKEKCCCIFNCLGIFCELVFIQNNASTSFNPFLFKEDGDPRSSVTIKPYENSSSMKKLGIGKGGDLKDKHGKVIKNAAVINDTPLKFKYNNPAV